MSENLTKENTNQTQVNQEVPEDIVNGIKNHYVKTFENEKMVFTIDLEANLDTIEMYNKIGDDISTYLGNIYEDHPILVGKREFIDVVKSYPKKKVFILTTIQHIRKHDIVWLMDFAKNNNDVKSYERTIKEPKWYYFLGIDTSKPYTIGLRTYSISLDDNELLKIAELVLKTMMNNKNLQLDKIETIGYSYRFAIFRKFWYIYQDKPQLKYVFKKSTDDSDDIENLDNDYYVTKTEWLYFVEFNSRFVTDTLDP